ncbi:MULTISPECIES: hybrid sensor histidine kinase/response regulator [Nostocales]|uniref:histidine kinase n=3 Tax=Nostocales TaxID=1161 RepID=A0A0C1QU23_9CYAN|nr:hybrid sensor histidine kinase/response regulator [Tolypothrix bouteillei]KAF3885379.1 hybrid sensor histidine kinase/response regulator [Tolypothrix bouteillei VB521301]
MMIEDEELRSLYKEASAEHIQKIEAALLHLEKNPQDNAKLEGLLREMHSLKGDSRMLGVKDAETLTHEMEEILGTVKRGEQVLTPQLFDCLYQGIDAVRKIAHEAITGQPAGVSVFHVLAQLMKVEPDDTYSEIQETTTDSHDTKPTHTRVEQPSVSTDAIHPNEPTELIDDQIDTIRVESERLDKLLTYVGELVVTKGQIANQLADLEEITTLWEDLNRQIFASRQLLQDSLEHLPDTKQQSLLRFSDLLENRLKQLGIYLNNLKNKTTDSSTKLEAVSDELNSAITSVRLIPLSAILNFFPRTVRDLAKQQNKEVNLLIEGGETCVDKRILEEMKDPLLHLLRNAVDHGIETPLERQQVGKLPTATIQIRATQTGNTVTIEVSDDGRGLDVEAIKQAAVNRGICTEEELLRMSLAEIQSLIFVPGFSTRTSVTEISGRGVGLDIVRANVERLKGKILVEFTPGLGCLFRITINSVLATTRVLIVEINHNPYAIPIEFVETMLLVSPQEIFAVEGSQTFSFQGQPVSIIWLADLLGLPVKIPSTTQALTAALKSIPCVILQLGSERLALLVDNVAELQEIVLKPQSSLLKRVCNIAGATILPTGDVCMVLSPTDLFKSAKKTVVSITVRELAEIAQIKKRILLVEDSVPIRTQMRRILEAAGYEVIVAVDGQDGFEKLSESQFDAVVSDVQMPNLDGFEFTMKIRDLAEYQELPVILVTTLATEQDKLQGEKVGANAYITKGQFEQGEFLDILRRLI